ncbi:MAG: [FeFe] hydrogenase H-cluster maturation GTPase HydF [Oscillospiraceae bacterium]|nr:[FeFe] hydrogenase H-cluster maturation GTPase HydF [Oscillospiraceae bacterium]
MLNTPNATRLHIAIVGDCNVGKSTLFNTLLAQNAALVSAIPGTTTDVVAKAVEFLSLGPVVLMDTAGHDDQSDLGKARIEKTLQALEKADIVLIVIRGDVSPQTDALRTRLAQHGTPFLLVKNVEDRPDALCHSSMEEESIPAITVNAFTGEGIGSLCEAIASLVPQILEPPLTAHLVQSGDIVLLVMPQDKQAPKGRLILPQQQVIRDLLDNGCTAISTTPAQLSNALRHLTSLPKLVITDSQVFRQVREDLPQGMPLTSFSMLFARAKGDIELFIDGANAIDSLRPGDRVLIAESCTHVVQDGDIGREKIPKLLNKHAGGELQFDFAVGNDFPGNLRDYKLVVQCGGCMFNRKSMLSRLEKIKNAAVPVTNYGVVIAKLQGVLEDTVI